MSILLWPKTAGTATPSTSPRYPSVPVIHARIAWRDEGFTMLSGADTFDAWTDGAGAATAAFDFRWTTSDTFSGGTALRYVSNATLNSGVGIAIPGTVVAGRPLTFRVGLRWVAGTIPVVLRAGNASDYAASTVTPTSTWAWHTVDWTPGTAVSDGTCTIMSGDANSQTVGFQHAELYEAFDEVTLETLHTTRGARFDGGSERPGTIEFTVLDPDAEYTPLNTASSLTGLVGPGRKVHIRGTYGGRLYPLAYGVVRGVTPDPDKMTTRFDCEDGLSELREYSVSRAFHTEKAYHTVRSEALTTEALAAAALALATDSTESDVCIDGTDDAEELLDFLEDLNEATGTVHYCAPQASAEVPWKYATLTRATLTAAGTDHVIDDDFQRLSDVSSRDESLITRQRVSWVGYEPHSERVVVQATEEMPYWTFSDEEYGSSDTPNPETVYTIKRRVKVFKGVHREGKKEVKWKQKRVVRRRKKVGTRWVDTVVPIAIAAGGTATQTIDFQMPMQDVSAAVTSTGGNVTTTLVTGPADVTLTMVASSADTVTDIVISAKPRRPTDETTESSSVGTLVREGAQIDNERIPGGAQAEGLADYLTWRYGAGRLRPNVVIQHKPFTQLRADLGDKVTLSADRWYIDAAPMVVRSIEHEFGPGGLDWETALGLEELPSGSRTWFTLDASALDGTDVLAY